MSETMHYKGKLIPTNQTVKEFLTRHKPNIIENLPSPYDTIEDYFNDNYPRCLTATIIEGKVFTIEREDLTDNDISESHLNDDGSYNFEIKYWGGSMVFTEALTSALKNNKE